MSSVQQAPPAKRRRGRETTGDMARSLGIVLILVIAIWIVAKVTTSDSSPLRVVDSTADVAALQKAAPGIPVPRQLPAQWRSTSSTLVPGESLRIGYVTPSNQYAEYAARTQPDSQWLADITGHGTEQGSVNVNVGTLPWRLFSDADRHETLVRTVQNRTIVVGGLRESASMEELLTLAGSVA